MPSTAERRRTTKRFICEEAVHWEKTGRESSCHHRHLRFEEGGGSLRAPPSADALACTSPSLPCSLP